MVRAFISYLQSEEDKHLRYLGRESWCEDVKIIPSLKSRLQRQEIKIAEALDVPVEELGGSWPK